MVALGTTAVEARRPYRAITWMVVSTLFLTINYAAVRHVSGSLHPFEIAFFRNLCGILILLPVLITMRFRPLRTSRFGGHLLRACINATSMLTYFWALSMTTLAEATAINFSGPIFAALLAVLLLKEKMTGRKLFALCCCVAGVLIITNPLNHTFNLGTLLLLASALFYGGVMVTMRTLASTESSLTVTAYVALLLTPLTLPFALMVWRWPSWTELLWLAAIGLFATVAQLALSQAFRDGETTLVVPFDFTRLLWATLFGTLLFHDAFDPAMFAGGALIFIGCLGVVTGVQSGRNTSMNATST